MAKYIVTFADKFDVICDTYNEAVAQKGFREIYLAPDTEKKWLLGHPAHPTKCFVLHNGEPVRAEWMPLGTNGIYWFLGYGETMKAVHKTSGWLPMEWFRSCPPDDEDMRQWQEEDEYGDREDYYDYGDPNEI